MPTTPVNYKESLPKGMMYPIRYGDIELSLVSLENRNTFLDCSFCRCTYRLTPPSNEECPRPMTLATLHYRNQDPYSYYLSGPWDDVDDPIVIDVCVYAIPTWLPKSVRPSRTTLRNMLNEHMPRLLATSLDRQDFRLTLSLDSDAARIDIECVEGEVHGIRKTTETFHVSLDGEQQVPRSS